MAPTSRSTVDSAVAESQSARVLLVDDEPRSLEVLSTLLTGHGATVRCAQGVSEAAAKQQHIPCDIALVSLNLPGRGGMDLLRHIRRMHPSIVVVLMANADKESLARSAVAEGAFDFLTRPVDEERVLGCVSEALASGSGRSVLALGTTPDVGRPAPPAVAADTPLAASEARHR